MPESKLSGYASRVRAYLHSPEGRANVRMLMQGRGYSYQRAVAESVIHVTHLVIYERIQEVTDQVMIEELGGEAA